MLVVVIIVSGLPVQPASAQLDPNVANRVASSTVMLSALITKTESGQEQDFRQCFLGSGSIVSADARLILTNSHVLNGVDLAASFAETQERLLKDENPGRQVELDVKEIVVSVVDHAAGFPDRRYRATALWDDPVEDLAVLRITGDSPGIDHEFPIGRSPLELGSSLGAGSVFLVGYPALANPPEGEEGCTPVPNSRSIQRFQGSVSGMDLERINVQTTASVGMSGGSVVDASGLLIGVPAEVQAMDAGGLVEVIPIETARSVLETAAPDQFPASSIAPTSTPSPPADSSAPTPIPPVTPNDQTEVDEARFFELLDARGESAPLAGPFAGELVQNDAFAALHGAGITTVDFSATATFVNPPQLSGRSWDFGFTFHHTADPSQFITVDSNGNWRFWPAPSGDSPSGVAPLFDSTPGAANTLDLVVDGDTALFGVNGRFVARLDLPPGIPSDVIIGSGYYQRTTEHGRAIAYTDFQVWPLPAPVDALSTTTPVLATNTPVPTPVTPTPADVPFDIPTPAVDPAAALRFDALLLETEDQPVAGPFAGELEETTPGEPARESAGVSLADFGASVTFTNPDTAVADVDVGFEFRVAADGFTTNRILVDSLRGVYAQPAIGAWPVPATAMAYDPTPGATNTLQLFVVADEALVGVNDQFVTAVPLLAPPVASDVSVGSAFFSVDFVQDRVTAFEDFRVWELPASTPPAVSPVAPTSTHVAPDTANAQNQPEEARFAELLAAREVGAAMAGPFAGEIVQSATVYSLSGAALTTTDFSATATFVNPVLLSGTSWDFGFTFHRTADTLQSIVVDSNGNWHFVPITGGVAASGLAPTFDPAPGAANTLDLLVDGRTALFGVNGQFVTRIDLPPAIPSDVQIGSGYFTNTTEDGRTIAFLNFEVWPLAAGAIALAPDTVDPTPGAPLGTPSPAADLSAAIRFATLVSESQRLPSTGPYAGALQESTPSQVQLVPAGNSLADFGASVTITNPDTTIADADVGFEFRASGDGVETNRIVVDSEGAIFTEFAGGVWQFAALAPSYDAAPGASNSIQIFVQANEALIGINNVFVVALDLLAAPIASDVSIGSAFFTDRFVQDRATAYKDFRVWELRASPA